MSQVVVSCAAVSGVEPTDLSAVKVGATRGQIEAVLGKPVASEEIGGLRADTYEYDRGASGLYHSKMARGYAAMALPLWAILKHSSVVSGQKGQLTVKYGPDGRAIDTAIELQLAKPEQRARAREQRARAEAGDADAQFELSREQRARAEAGDADAQFELYKLSRTDEEESKWLCRSAHGGDARAQYVTGRKRRLIYKWSADRKAIDPVQAYLWYGLAARNGHYSARFEHDDLAETMTPAQIAEAERLVREWKPDPESCEAEGKQAGAS
jgi:hypothetical protein